MAPSPLLSPLHLPCGVTLKNRLVKAAMTERMSNNRFDPTNRHIHLYEQWAQSGAGLLITGNVVVDPKHLESAGNVYIGHRRSLPALKRWAQAATSNHTEAWVQISHAGRQTNRFINTRPKAPSEVQLGLLGLFGKPKSMTSEEIQVVIDSFVKGAVLCKEAGFTGVQFHAAHGYLLSQFLSPNTNLRQDEYGGNIENRSRVLRTIIDRSREALGPEFPISVKLNSSDFQRGGFTEEDSVAVIRMLEGKIDLLEISGGTYEEMVVFELNDQNREIKESTKQREAYFIEFAKQVRAVSSIPLLITGGVRSYDFCNRVLEDGEVDLIGMARPFLTNLEEIPSFLQGQLPKLKNLVFRSRIKVFNSSSEAGFYARQLLRMASGKPVKHTGNALWSATFLILHEFRMAITKRLV